MHRFIVDHNKFRVKRVSIVNRTTLSYHSVGNDGITYKNDDRYAPRLKTVYPRNINTSVGFDLHKKFNLNRDNKDCLNRLLEWITTQPGKTLYEAAHVADFVAWNETYKRICSFFRHFYNVERQVKSEIHACRVGDVIFLKEDIIPSVKEKTEVQKKNQYSRCKYAQVITTNKDGEDHTKSPYDCDGFYEIIVKSELQFNNVASHFLLCGGEVDALDMTGRRYEIKQTANFISRYNAMDWLIQSDFIGIDNFVVGIRDDQYMVKETVHKTKADLQKILNWKIGPGKEKPVSEQHAYYFLHDLLSTIKKDYLKENGTACRILMDPSISTKEITIDMIPEPEEAIPKILTHQGFLDRFKDEINIKKTNTSVEVE